jgi:hypothetical protein
MPLNSQEQALSTGAAMEKTRRQAGNITDDLIEAMTQTHMGHASARHRHVFREALRGLVRMAKAEKLRELKRDTALALGNKRDDQE